MKCTHCTNEIKPIVCLDVDGTLADYHGHFLRFACQYMGAGDEAMAQTYRGDRSLAQHLGISKEEYRTIKLAYRQGGLKRSMPMYVGADSLSRQLKAMGVEVWITTTRPYMRLDNIDPDTREWLRRNGIVYDHIFYDDRKYAKLCEMVDPERIVAVLDDDPAMIDQAAGRGLPTVWRKSGYNAKASPPARNWHSPIQCTVGTMREADRCLSVLVLEWRKAHERPSMDA